MEVRDFFIGRDGHLRSGWRVLFFTGAFLACAKLFEVVAWGISSLIGRSGTGIWSTARPFLVGALVLFSSATLVGWACGAIFEGLKFRSLGWWPHKGWLKNVAFGSLMGAASLFLAVGFAAVTGGIRFSFNPSPATTIGKTVAVTLIVFVIAGAAEEALFRGYPLQTFTRANLAWVGLLVTSLPFAAAHLANPNVSRGFTFFNTALAGLWLGVAYLRTRSLWFPLGVHWSWNWTQSALLGIPVSGIERISPAPVLHAMNMGPDWLTGGRYGIEGGAACTAALLISTVVIWRTRFLSTADDSPAASNEVAYATPAQ
jgi:membrane protease YdiL (CAAX protease family)